MKKFALPQQKETSVNNLTKMSELFKKYNIFQIGRSYTADSVVNNIIDKLYKNTPNSYTKELGLVLFLFEFANVIGSPKDKIDEITKRVQNNNSIINTYLEKVESVEEYNELRKELKKHEEEEEEKKKQQQPKAKDDESADDSAIANTIPWDDIIGTFIKKHFLDDISPTAAPTVAPTVVKPLQGPVPSIWHPEFLDRVEAVVKGGLSYFDTFLSGLAPMLGDKQSYHLYKYQYKVIDRNVTSLDEFVRKNSHLGRNFFVEVMPLLMSEEQIRLREKAKQELIGPDANIFPALKIPKLVEDEAYLLELVNNNFE
jgi:hypothetical protein